MPEDITFCADAYFLESSIDLGIVPNDTSHDDITQTQVCEFLERRSERSCHFGQSGQDCRSEATDKHEEHQRHRPYATFLCALSYNPPLQWLEVGLEGEPKHCRR